MEWKNTMEKWNEFGGSKRTRSLSSLLLIMIIILIGEKLRLIRAHVIKASRMIALIVSH